MLENGIFFEETFQSIHHFESEFFMRHLTTAEEYLDTNFMTLGEELTDLAELDVEVTLTNLHPETHLLEFVRFIAAAVFLRLFHLLVLVFTPVDDFCNRWISVRRDFNQVESGVGCGFQCIAATEDTELLTIWPNNA